MEQYKLETIQNISIDRPVASVAERIVSTLIDLAIIGIFYLFLLVVLNLDNHPVWLMILSIPVFFYSLLSELLLNGQSPGKKVLKIKVFSDSGADISFMSMFIRWVFRIIDVFMLFGSIATLSIIISKKSQRLGDMVASTIVLSTREKKKTGSVIVDLPEDYQLSFPEVENLSMGDLRIINEVIEFLKSSYYSDEARTYAEKTKVKIENKLQISSELDPVKFLYTVVKDFNYIQQSKNY